MTLPLARTLAILALCAAPLAHAQEIMEFGNAAPRNLHEPLIADPTGPKLNRPSNTNKQPISLDRPLARPDMTVKPDMLSLKPDLMSILPQELSADDGDDPMVDGTAELALRAVQYLGIPYRRGGTGPTGFDCSGLVRFVFGEVLGLKLPHRAEEIVNMGQELKSKDLEPGDLVFYNTMGRRNSHVGIYLGDNRFVHAPSSGGVVRIESMELAYWKKRFNGARRIDVASLSSR
ncbi:C40 family peptidase [Pigmentiphaga aceris]|nr:C40 family peptidase [Pigmentiphaga aceris]